MLKGLDFVAITDHNSAKQLNTVEKIEGSYDFIFIPGIEVTVKEGFDVLCYFRTYDEVSALDKYLEYYLTDDFGPFSKEDQIITDIYDMKFKVFEKSLMKTTIPYIRLYTKVKELNGLAILAHVDRGSKSAMNNHNINELNFDGIEIQKLCKDRFMEDHPELKKYQIIFNSDSHTLLQISEREDHLDLEEKSIDAFFNYFTKT